MPADRFLNLTGCPMDQMIALVRQPATFIGNDSGPMHLSAASGNRVLAIFGPTSPRRFGPFPLEHPKHRAVEAPGGRLADLEPAEVLAELRREQQRLIDEADRIQRLIDELEQHYQQLTTPRPESASK